MTRKAGRDTDGPRGRLYADSDPMHLPCDGVDAKRGHEPRRRSGRRGVKTETMTRSLTDLSSARPPKSFRSQDLEGQATVKPFLMFVFESVSGGNDCTRGVDPDDLSGRRARTCARTRSRPECAQWGTAERQHIEEGSAGALVEESHCRGHPVAGHQ